MKNIRSIHIPQEYRDINNLPAMDDGSEELKIIAQRKTDKYQGLVEMSRDELVDEIKKQV